MPLICECRDPHAHTRVVLTGGPGAGKTAVLELVRQHFCEHVHVLPESAGIVLCDRGTADGAAYWPGPDDLWSAVGTSLEDQLRRYDAVIHLRTPGKQSG